MSNDERGATVVEFALILPAFLTLVMGTFEVGHQLYVRALLNGAMEKAARDSGLMSGVRNQVIIDGGVERAVSNVLNFDDPGTQLTFKRRNYLNVDDVGKMEAFTDSDGDARCDLGEEYEDANASDGWDERGADGQGGARAAVQYSVTLKYDRLFPVAKLIGISNQVEMTSFTVLRNQPYDTTKVVVVIKKCTLEDR